MRNANFEKRLIYGFLPRKILEILQFFNILKFMKQWRMSALPYFAEFVVAAIITMRLLILEILCGDESLILIFHFLSKVMVPVYYSVYPPLLL